MLRWPYLWNPPLDHIDFWICCSYHTPLLIDLRDWKENNLLDNSALIVVPALSQKSCNYNHLIVLSTFSLSNLDPSAG